MVFGQLASVLVEVDSIFRGVMGEYYIGVGNIQSLEQGEVVVFLDLKVKGKELFLKFIKIFSDWERVFDRN